MTDVAPRPAVLRLSAYEEDVHGGLNLSNNANLFGTNPALGRALALAQSRVGTFWDYPSLSSEPLREAIGRKLGVAPDRVVTGNGSNELIDTVIRTYADPGETVAFHAPIFSMVPVFARAAGVEPVAVPLGAGWTLNPDALLHREGKVTFVCTPNNPTGNAFPRADVLRVVERAHGIVVVDEAYGEFHGESFVRLTDTHRNLVVLRTMSKAHGLAGLRVGYAVAHPDVARQLAKIRGPFRLNAFSELAASLALQDDAFVEETVRGVRTNRPLLAKALGELGFEVFPSEANFLLARPPVDATLLADALARQQVYVRGFTGDLAPYLRITIGPAHAMERFLAALRPTLKELQG